jgi:hypothetical protein
VDFVNSWLSAWAEEIVFSLVIGSLCGLVTFAFGEYGKGE